VNPSRVSSCGDTYGHVQSGDRWQPNAANDCHSGTQPDASVVRSTEPSGSRYTYRHRSVQAAPVPGQPQNRSATTAPSTVIAER
jgi:hypothetical protein